MRTYQQTHPWITFRTDLDQLSFRDWMLLGEAQSKCAHIAGVPLLPDVRDELHRIYLAKGVLATTAIEGNTLTEEEALRQIAGTLRLPPSKAYLGIEIDNVVAACNEIADRMLHGGDVGMTVDLIKHYNFLVLRNLPLPEDAEAGKVRRHPVIVGPYRGAPPEDLDYLLERFAEWVNTPIGAESDEYRVAFGIVKAILAHLYLAWIHPFGDGNGRTARLIEFHTLLAAGVPSAAAHLLSNHYNQSRSEYYRQLDQTSRSGGDTIPFIRYALQGLVDGLKEELDVVYRQQIDVHWIHHVHALFPDPTSATAARRRRLALDLGKAARPVPLSEVRYISTRMAEAYGGKTDKTVQRDINALVGLQLVEKHAGGVRARLERMLEMRPPIVRV